MSKTKFDINPSIVWVCVLVDAERYGQVDVIYKGCFNHKDHKPIYP